MTGLQKVAILFRVLGKEFAEPMCEQMRPEEVSRVAEAMVRFEDSPPSAEDVKATLEEFKSMVADGGSIFANVNETLAHIFSSKFGPDKGPTMLEEVRVNAQIESPFKGLQGIPYPDLQRVLSEEHPQVQAAVLANIDPESAAGVLGCLEPEERKAMVRRIAKMKPPPPRVLRDIADMFIEKTAKLPRYEVIEPAGANPSVKCAASILNAATAETNDGLLDGLLDEDEDLVQELRETMFTFDDLATVDKMTMQKILGSIDTNLLALALKSCSAEVSASVFAAVSQRTKEMILEEKELMGAVPLTEVQDAQKQIMATIRGMIESGELDVSVGGAGAQLVE